jgi:spore maturation protein CgeB
MRFLVCQPGPAFSVHDLYVGWTEALTAAGQQVFEYNLHDRLTYHAAVLLPVPGQEGAFKKANDTPERVAELAVEGLANSVLKRRPHVLLLISGFFMPTATLDAIRAAGVRVVVVHTESPYEDDRQLQLAAHADLNLVNDPTNLERFRAVAPSEYFGHAYRPALHRPGAPTPNLVCDLGFVGTGYPSRVEFFEAMGITDLDVLLAGNWRLLADDSPLRPFVGHELDDCLDNADAAAIYRSMRAGLNLYRRDGLERPEFVDGWALGPREVEMAACGAFFLRDPRGEGDELLDMLPTFTSPAEASDQLRWWLAHPEQREAAAEKARAAVADRTFDTHARRLMRLLERK